MNKDGMKNSIGYVILHLKADTVMLEAIRDNLPDLPDGCSYEAIDHFQIKPCALYALSLSAVNRETAVKLVKTFKPLKLYYNKEATATPMFRPKSGIIHPEFKPKWRQVWPVIFSSRYHKAAAVGDDPFNPFPFESHMIWYHRLLPDLPELKIYISVRIMNDPARVYEKGGENYMPDGLKYTEEIIGLGQRLCIIYWPAKTSAQDWLSKLQAQIEIEEWPDLL